MASFTYEGMQAGAKVSGTLDAVSSTTAAEQLRSQGITPIRIVAAQADKTIRAAKKEGERPASEAKLKLALPKFDADLFAPKVKQEDLLLFCRQIQALLRAGVPIMNALASLQESASNPVMVKTMADLRQSLESGMDLSTAMARKPKVFSPFFIAMVRVGESTGRMEEIFSRLHHHIQFESEIKQQVKSALRYPLFVVLAMAVALVILNIFVIPAFSKVFAGLGAKLPLMTQFLLAFSNAMVNYGWLMLVAVVGAYGGFRLWTQTESGKMAWDRLIMKLPIAGPIVHQAALARFAKSMATTIKSGLPILSALSSVAMTVDNVFVAKRVAGMRESIERGDSVMRAAKAAGIFTPVVIQMIAVGEESGSLDDMMLEVGQMYTNNVEYELKTLSQKIEPILIVFMGVLVLVLALGVFLPIWDLGSASMRRGG